MSRIAFRNRRHSSLATVLWINAVLLAGILGVLISHGNGPSLIPVAQGQQLNNIGGGGGVYVIPAQFSATQWGCYLIDIDQQNLVAYEFFGGEKQLKFVAARSFKYDRRISNYSTSPSPADIEKIVKQAQTDRRTETEIPPLPSPMPVPAGLDHDGGKTNDHDAKDALPPEPH